MGPPKLPKGSVVKAYLERAPGKMLDLFEHELDNVLPDPNGVYVLYQREEVYYVGLTSNMRGRLKHHQQDRHAGKWDRFSVYVIRRVHMKDLETILLHVARPPGNRNYGRLARRANLLPKLQSRAQALRRMVEGAG